MAECSSIDENPGLRCPRVFSNLVALILCSLFARTGYSHPGSGIVVDHQGQVFFQDTLGRTIWRIDTLGRVEEYHLGIGGHWMCIDEQGSFARTQPKFFFGRITPTGAKPALIVAEGGAPIAVCQDGNLYYGSWSNGRDPMAAGALNVTRMTPDGRRDNFSPQLPRLLEERKDGITGLAPGPEGSLYVAAANGVLKVAMDGAVSLIAYPVVVKECTGDGDGAPDKPRLRGVAVDSDGTVYAAAFWLPFRGANHDEGRNHQYPESRSTLVANWRGRTSARGLRPGIQACERRPG